MKYQIDEGYKSVKLSWAVKLAPLMFLAGAAMAPIFLGAVEGAVEGWNCESMRKQALLTKKFERKYQETISTKGEYSINKNSVENYLNKTIV